jgi:Predicted integral membrane protein (DUF2269)
VSKAFWIQVFLLLHVLGAIAALGPTLTYALWRRRAETMAREHLVFTLETVGWVDSRIATPAYISQAVTGTVIIALTGINIFHTAWLLTGVAIYVVIAVGAPVVYVPLVRRQLELATRLEADPQDASARDAYEEASSRSRTVGLAIVALTVAVVYFMVVKPTLWSAG